MSARDLYVDISMRTLWTMPRWMLCVRAFRVLPISIVMYRLGRSWPRFYTVFTRDLQVFKTSA